MSVLSSPPKRREGVSRATEVRSFEVPSRALLPVTAPLVECVRAGTSDVLAGPNGVGSRGSRWARPRTTTAQRPACSYGLAHPVPRTNPSRDRRPMDGTVRASSDAHPRFQGRWRRGGDDRRLYHSGASRSANRVNVATLRSFGQNNRGRMFDKCRQVALIDIHKVCYFKIECIPLKV